MISGKHLYLSVKTAIRTLKGRRREPAAFLVAALCFSGGFALGKLLADKWITRLQIALYAIGAIAFVYGAIRVWKLVNPPELPPARIVPRRSRDRWHSPKPTGICFASWNVRVNCK